MNEDSDIVLPEAEYDALLARYPWIRSREPYAYLSRGWKQIAVEMLDELNGIMTAILADHPRAHVTWTTKEKLGGLRMYFRLRGAPGVSQQAMTNIVLLAEARSLRTCERCGEPGRVRNIDGWFLTRC